MQARIRLSDDAEQVIKKDCYLFEWVNENNKPKRGGFINEIFLRYYNYSRMNLKFLRDEADQNSEKRGEIFERYYLKEWKNRARHFKEKTSMEKHNPITLRTDTEGEWEKMQDESGEYYEKFGEYYREYGKYSFINFIIEDYAELPLKTRIKVFYKENFDKIYNAVKAGKTIYINGKDEFLPLALDFDSDEVRAYAAGLKVDSQTESPIKETVSYRIDKLRSIDIGHKCNIGESERSFFDEELKQRGIAFMVNEVSEIRIQLTERGVRNYRQWISQRPNYVRIENNNEYIFNISEFQAEVYFFKFGKEAKVLSPQPLADKFLNKFKEAAALYE